MRKAILLCWMLLALAGCTWSGPAASRYIGARLHDLIDVAHVDLTLNSCGLLANAGPIMLGYKAPLSRRFPRGQHAISVGRIGYALVDVTLEQGEAYGFLVPLSRLRVRRGGAPSGAGGKGYGGKVPGWGSVGFDVGFFLGVGAHADVVELLDFVTGFFGADISKDDSAGIYVRVPARPRR